MVDPNATQERTPRLRATPKRALVDPNENQSAKPQVTKPRNALRSTMVDPNATRKTGPHPPQGRGPANEQRER
ncbi:hypothetical protein CAURIS_02615 [Corynebacterium auris]|nr:hypothetical protein CAURIS_02615 [Corynebacterium auris]